MALYKTILGVLMLFFNAHIVYGRSPSEISFIENRGQWKEAYKYRADIPGGSIWIEDGSFMYCYTSDEDMEMIEKKWESGINVDSESVRGHRYRVHFKGSNEDILYTGHEERSWYHNYYHSNDSAAWRGRVPLYGAVVMENVYKGVDAKIYAYDSGLKYDFIVHPGGDAGHIVLEYEGVNPVIDNEGKLHITTSINEIIEEKPYAYQIINEDTVVVPCHYVLNEGDLSFAFPEGYDSSVQLIIDPELVFVTYSGAGPFSGGYFSFCSTYDALGNFYVGGIPQRVFWIPDPLWPTTPGAFQEAYTSIYEPMVCINKYDPTGSNLLFSTYFGGSGPNDIPHAMVANEQGELILAGSTGSFNLPVTEGCFDDTKSGGTDMFLAHFTADGSSLIGATYIGGELGNSINAIDIYSTSGFTGQNKISPVEITLDSVGNIWAVTNTSTIDFPVTANAFQPGFGGGNCDGIAIGLTADCTQMLYGTYIGGSNTDVAYSIRMNSTGKLVVCGGTMSNNFPVTAGAYQTVAPGSGEWDGYVMIIDPVSGSLQQATYLGTDGKDQATNLQIDTDDNIYVLGRTFGNYPVSPNVYSMPGTDLFVDKLAPDLSASLLSTRLGNPQSDTNAMFPTAFLLDNCDHIYVGGLSQYYTRSLSNMPLTADAFQTMPANFWFGVLNPDFESLLYGTYIGRAHDTVIVGTDTSVTNGDHTHVGTYRLDPHGLLYQSICANSLYYPGTTPGSWSPYNRNGYISGNDTGVIGQDIVSFKFRFDLSGTDAGNITINQNDSGCAPYTLQFNSITYAAQTYHWDFGDGTTSTEISPAHTYTEAGTYQVMLAVHNDTVICRNDDTAYKTITIFNPQVPDIISNDTLVCDSAGQVLLQVALTNPGVFGNDYEWESLTGGGIISAWNNTAIVNPNIDTAYIITVWDTIAGYCGYAARDTVYIDYKPRRLSIAPTDTLICKGAGVTVVTTGTEGYTYSWTPATGVSGPADQNPVITPGQTGTYMVTASYPGCNDTSGQITIRVDNPVITPFIHHRDSICAGEAIGLEPGNTDSTIIAYIWNFGDDSYLDIGEAGITNMEIIRHAYDEAGTMVVTLTTRTRACPDTIFSDTVYVFPLPVVNLNHDTALCLGGSPIYLQNEYAGNNNIRSIAWSTGDTAAVLKVVHPGTYSLTVKTEPIGCSTTDVVEVKKDCYIDVPNVFTPNGDGINDYFFPRQYLSKGLTQFKMQVFNRWGQVVFETVNINGRGWDGRYNGREQPGGVYVYIIDATIDNDRREHYEGNVTLLR